MRKLMVTEFLSLDGVMENPMWTFPYWNDEIAAFKGEETSASDALLLGRVTYEGFAAAWPESKDEGAEYFNNVRKYVVSTTLKEPLEWNNSTLLTGDLATAVAKLKEQVTEDITVLGSGELIQSLMRDGLVDEYVLLIHPLVLGSGRHHFPAGSPTTDLELVDSVTTSTGVIIATYRPSGAAVASNTDERNRR